MSVARHIAALLVVVGGAALVACSEKPQTIDQSARKADTAPWAASEQAVPGFAAPGWKRGGDAAAWEQQIHGRNQGQNDYAPRL